MSKDYPSEESVCEMCSIENIFKDALKTDLRTEKNDTVQEVF